MTGSCFWAQNSRSCDGELGQTALSQRGDTQGLPGAWVAGTADPQNLGQVAVRVASDVAKADSLEQAGVLVQLRLGMLGVEAVLVGKRIFSGPWVCRSPESDRGSRNFAYSGPFWGHT